MKWGTATAAIAAAFRGTSVLEDAVALPPDGLAVRGRTSPRPAAVVDASGQARRDPGLVTARTCQTCKHYEPSAMWRKGWCRNPRLYSPQQSQMVDQDGLDCSRGFGNAWEPIESDETTSARQPLRLFGVRPQLATAMAGGGVIASATGPGSGSGSGSGFGSGGGSGGASGWPSPQGGPPRRPPGGPPPGQERTVSYQPEERYWTDYLRIALPVLGLLLMLGLFWFWVNELVNDEDTPNQPTAGPAAAIDEENAPTATATVPAAVPGITPSPAPAPSPSPQPSPSPDEQAAAPGQAEASESGIFNGATVIANGAEFVNIRSQASAESEISATATNGTVLRVTGEGEASEGFTWWPVTNDATGESGFVREDVLQVQQQ